MRATRLPDSYALADRVRNTFLLVDGRVREVAYPGASQTGTFGITPQGDVYGVYVLNGVGHGYVYSTSGGFTTIDYPGATLTLSCRTASSPAFPAASIADNAVLRIVNPPLELDLKTIFD